MLPRLEVVLHIGTPWHWNHNKPGLQTLSDLFRFELCFRWETLVQWRDSLHGSRLESRSRLPWDPWVSRVEGNCFHANGLSSCAASKRPEVSVLHYLFIYGAGVFFPFRKGPLLEREGRNSLFSSERTFWTNLAFSLPVRNAVTFFYISSSTPGPKIWL